MPTVGFDNRLEFRIRDDEKEKAKEIVKNNPELYANVSHFARAWFIRGLRQYNINNEVLLDDQAGNE